MTKLKRIYQEISSMKTGLMLLAFIAVASALGSAIMPEVFFRTLLFQLLLILIIFNMVLCTFKRLVGFNWRLLKVDLLRFFRELGIMLLHVGIILIMAGAGVYLAFGQSTIITLVPGSSVDLSKQIKLTKPFSIALTDFKMNYYDDGSASQYYSQVQTVEDDGIKQAATISVNHPLIHQGIKVYQESYGYKAELKVTNPGNKDSESLLDRAESLTVPGTEKSVKLYAYIPNYDPDYGMNSKTERPDNPRVIFSVYEKDKMVGVGVTKLGETTKLDDKIAFTFTGIKPYTVLKVKSDPGLPVTAAGGILLMLGVSMAQLSGGWLIKKSNL